MLGQDLEEIFKEKHQVISWNRGDVDITKRETTISNIKNVRPDAIINASAFNDVDGAEKDPRLREISFKVNCLGVKYLAEAASEINLIFVHYSTDYVFDGKNLSYPEYSQTCPISNHGRSKEGGEKNIEDIGGRYYIIRLSRLFGKLSKSSIGKESFFCKLLKSANEKKILEVVDDEISCFTYAPDLANATKRLVETKHPYGIYHLINEGGVSWYEGAKKLFEIMEIKDIELIPISSDKFVRPAKRPKSSILVNTKFPKLRTFEDAIREWK